MAKKKGSGKHFEFTPQNFTVGFDVYPLIAMIRENALRLAQNLSAHHELTDIHMSDESWQFTRPQPRQGRAGGAIQVVVEDQEVKIAHRYPNGGLERFEILVEQVIEAVEKVAEPQILLGTTTSLEYLVDIDGDAREAIVGALRLPSDDDESDKLGVFNRPCQFVGLRLGFPPYRLAEGTDEAEGERHEELMERLVSAEEGSAKQEPETNPEGADWQATLTLQSLPEEPSKLSVEVEGRWMAPNQWKDVPKVIGNRLKTVDDFLRTTISEFLKHFRSDE